MTLNTLIQRSFSYDPDSGQITRIKTGKTILTLTSKGYVQLSLGRGRNLLGHRVAWFLANGEWPLQIDHINGIRNDNRLANLRNVDATTNRHNRLRSHGKSADLPIGITRKTRGSRVYFVASLRRGDVCFEKCSTTLEQAMTHLDEMHTLADFAKDRTP